MKIFNSNISLYFSTCLVVFIILLGACEKNGGNNPPVDPTDTTPTDTTPSDSVLLEITQSVSAIAIGKDNTKWIGTSSGLYKSVSEGYILVDTLGEIEINTLLFEEELNLLWVGTNSSILKITLSNADIIDYSIISSDKLSNPNISASYLDASSRKWFGTQTGITLNHDDYWKKDSFRINSIGKVFPLDLESMQVNSIAALNGDYFFATSGGYIYRAIGADASVDAFTGASQWVDPYNGTNLTSNMNVVFIDSKGNKWMGGENGIQTHNGNDPKNMEEFRFYNEELVGSIIYAVAEAPNGKIWIGTEAGISLKDGELWTAITENLPSLHITSIAFDKADGSAWIGTKMGLINIK